MAKPAVIFDTHIINRLKIEIGNKLGYVISNKMDCEQLSKKILDEGIGYISESTLYRLFLHNTSHRPYRKTLDLLCNFLGYQNSNEYLKDKINSYIPDRSNYKESLNDSLLFICIENKNYKSLNTFFEKQEEKPILLKETLAIDVFDCLLSSRNTASFFKFFAHQNYIREFLLEKAHDPAFRIQDYERAYIYYLEKIRPEKDLKEFQDFIFGNCVLFRYYYLSNQKNKALKISTKLYSGILDINSIKSQIHIFPYIRYMAYKLWHIHITNTSKLNTQIYALQLLEICKELKFEHGEYERKIIFHTIGEALLFSNAPEEILNQLKEIYQSEFNLIPKTIFKKHIKHSLTYFEPNGLLYHRPY